MIPEQTNQLNASSRCSLFLFFLSFTAGKVTLKQNTSSFCVVNLIYSFFRLQFCPMMYTLSQGHVLSELLIFSCPPFWPSHKHFIWLVSCLCLNRCEINTIIFLARISYLDVHYCMRSEKAPTRPFLLDPQCKNIDEHLTFCHVLWLSVVFSS